MLFGCLAESFGQFGQDNIWVFLAKLPLSVIASIQILERHLPYLCDLLLCLT